MVLNTEFDNSEYQKGFFTDLKVNHDTNKLMETSLAYSSSYARADNSLNFENFSKENWFNGSYRSGEQ